MIKETVYVAINRNDEIQWVRGSSRQTRYFKTDRYLKGAVERHNKERPNDIWKVRKCVILEDEPQTEVVNDSQDLVKDLVKAFCEDGTWLERQGVYTLTLAEAKQRAVDIIESVTAERNE